MDVQQQIGEIIKNNEIVLFMKGTPDFPQCGFSGRSVQILQTIGAQFIGVNVLENDEVREGIKQFSSWPTIPQLYVKGEFVGGSDIMLEMYENEELPALINEKSEQV